MPILNLDEAAFGDNWEWQPLNMTDAQEAVRDFHKTTAQQEGEQKYKRDVEEYEAAMSYPEQTPDRRSAVDTFKRVMGR